MESKRRFLVPILFIIVCIPITIMIVLYLTEQVVGRLPPYDFIPILTGGIQNDVRTLLYLLFPIYTIIFFVLTIPIALLMMFFNKLSRAATYEIGIFPTGKNFSPIKMIRRAVVPSLFALSSSEIVVNLLPDWIFRIPEVESSTAQLFLRLFDPLQTIIGALVTLVIALVLFAPTWILNDTGIITQVKADQMSTRRCPDSEGVGRWYSNLFGGFAIFAYPITMFYRYFYSRYVLRPLPLQLDGVLLSLFWIIGIPLLIMSFVLPFILLNELELDWVVPRIQRFARALGAKDTKPKSLMVEMMEVQEHLENQSTDDDLDSDTSRLKRM